MRLRVDVEVQHVAFLAVGRARLVFAAVGHLDGNRMIIRVNIGLHGLTSAAEQAIPAPFLSCSWKKSCGFIHQRVPLHKLIEVGSFAGLFVSASSHRHSVLVPPI